MQKTNNTRGGARKGAGRKPRLSITKDGKQIRIGISRMTPAQIESLMQAIQAAMPPKG